MLEGLNKVTKEQAELGLQQTLERSSDPQWTQPIFAWSRNNSAFRGRQSKDGQAAVRQRPYA